MAQAGYTPIQLYYSSTATNVPSAGNLSNGELAINIADGKLYYKDSGGSVQLLASNASSTGTVSTVSVVSANGFAGTVANATTTPAITLTTSITGLLQGDGTAISAVTVGTGLSFSGGTLSATGTSSQWTTSGSDIYYNTGNVGIGTTTTTNKLNVSGAGVTKISIANSSVSATGYMEIDNSSYFNIYTAGGMFIGPTGANPLQFQTNNTERMRINSSGNVGIGTSSPSARLDVRTAAGTAAQINLYSGDATTVSKFSIGQVASIDWDIGLTSTSGNFQIGGLGGSVATAYSIGRSGTAVIYHAWNTSATERMRITSSGGISFGSSGTAYGTSGQVLTSAGNAPPTWTNAATGTVTSVSFTGGLISVATATTTPALTVAGTSGGIVYFSSASTWASSGVLAANAIVLGGGAGAAPATTTTGTGVVTALGISVNNATGGLVTSDGTTTLSNKSITARVSSTTSITSPLNTWTSASFDMYAATAQAGNLTIAVDSNASPTDGQKITFRITSDATPRVITFTGGASKGFKPVGVTMTTSGSNFTYTLTASKTTYFGAIYNTNSARWEIVAISQEA